jgi:uncharacterized protein
LLAIDTNILVYAHRRDVREHDTAQAVVRGMAEGTQTWAIAWPCLYEFFSVVTNPRIWKDAASSPDQAAAQIDAWVGSPSLRLIGETSAFWPILRGLLELPRVRGPVVHDARIAAICIAHGIDTLLTRDRDFSLFPRLVTRNPLE